MNKAEAGKMVLVNQSTALDLQQAVVDLFLKGQKPSTRRAYGYGLRAFADYIGARDINEAAGVITRGTPVSSVPAV